MFISPRAAMRLRLSIAAPVHATGLGGGVSCAMTSRTAAVSSYKPFADARNAAQGGADAWSPPV
jgi:hypothetical protein